MNERVGGAGGESAAWESPFAEMVNRQHAAALRERVVYRRPEASAAEEKYVYRRPEALREQAVELREQAKELRARRQEKRARERTNRQRRLLAGVSGVALLATLLAGGWGNAEEVPEAPPERPEASEPDLEPAMPNAGPVIEITVPRVAAPMVEEPEIATLEVTAPEPEMTPGVNEVLETVAEMPVATESAVGTPELEQQVAAFSERAREKFAVGELDLREGDLENMIAVYGEMLRHGEEGGLGAEHIAGIMGNMFQESRFRTEDGDPSMGLIQWTGPRKTGLYNFASERGVDPTAVATQVEFMFYERWNAQGEATRWERFLETETVDEAVQVFCEEVERAGTPNMEARLGFGRQIAECMGAE